MSSVLAHRRRHLGAALVGAAALLLMTLLGTLPSDAHAVLLDTDPTAGAVVQTAPTEVKLTC